MEFGRPDEPASADADEGTALHEAVAAGVCPPDFTSEQRDLVEFCQEYKSRLGGRQESEVKMVLVGTGFKVVMEGTSDLVCEVEDAVDVVDWKFGRVVVDDPVDNIQLAAYAAMAMQKYGKPARVHVVQPRVSRTPQAPFLFTDEAALVTHIERVIARCESGMVSFCDPADMGEACRYCRARLECPSHRDTIMGSLEKVEALAAEKKFSAALLTPEEMSSIYLAYSEKIKLLKKFWESLENRIKTECLKNTVCGGLTIKKRKGNRVIKDVEGAFQAMQGRLDTKEFLAAVTLSPAKLEEIFVAKLKAEEEGKGRKVKKADLEDLFAETLGTLIGNQADVISIAPVAESA